MPLITTTHVVLNAALSRLSTSDADGRVARGLRRLLPDRGSRIAIILGGLAPDLGLTLLTAGAAVWFPTVEGWTLRQTGQHVFGVLFFEDRAWIAIHSLLHAPPVLLTLLALGAAGRRRDRRWGRWLMAFAVGCLAHTAADILTHVDDGPLLLWPLDWGTRFHSPVSYYDPDHYGRVLGPIDTAITVLGGGYLTATWWRRRRAAATAA